MQLLALFLLAVSAGALPQSPDPVDSTMTHVHEKRLEQVKPSIGNFDDPKCHGKFLGTNSTSSSDITKCFKFTPVGQSIHMYWGSSSGVAWIFSNDHCDGQTYGNPPLKVIRWDDGDKLDCVSVKDLGGKVQSALFPGPDVAQTMF